MTEIEGQQGGGNYEPQGAESRAFVAPHISVDTPPVFFGSTATTGITKAAGLEAPTTELPPHDLHVSTWEDEGGLTPPGAEGSSA